MKATVAALALLALTGCATAPITIEYALTPKPNVCAATESRPTWQSNIVGVVCWDADAKPIGMGAAGGTSTAAVTTSLIGSTATLAAGAATLGGAAIVADGLRDAAKLMPTTITTTGTVSGNVTTSGTVTGTIAPLTVQPIPTLTVAPVPPLTGTINLVPVLP